MSRASRPPSYKSSSTRRDDPPPPYTSHEANEQTSLLQQRTNERLVCTLHSRQEISPEARELWSQQRDRQKQGAKISKWIRAILMGIFIGGVLASLVIMGRNTWKSWVVDVPRVVEIVKIGVVGAGPAGISTAYTLSQISLPYSRSREVQLQITIFDQNPTLGGRLTLPSSSLENSIRAKELHLEDLTTSCLAHTSILRARAKSELAFNYGLEKNIEPTITKTGFWDGENVVAEIPRPRGKVDWGTWMKLIWRYGASVWRASVLPDGTEAGFTEMMRKSSFPSHSRAASYSSAWEILEQGGMTGAAGMGAMERLSKNGVEGKYVEEIIRPQVRRQFGSEVEEISDLALSVVLKRENGETCFNGEGGRVFDVLKKFVDKSRAKINLNTEVTGIKRETVEEGKKMWVLETKSRLNESAESEYEAFDHVVIAGPWNSTILQLETGVTEEREEVLYRPVHTTFISTTSPPRFSTLDALLPTQTPPNFRHPQIYELTYLRQIYTLSTQSLVNNTSLYRVLSDSALSARDIDDIFGGENVKEGFGWKIDNAWPISIPRTNGEGLGEFKLEEGLWGTSMGEGIVSGVDWSWVVGENVGRAVGGVIRR